MFKGIPRTIHFSKPIDQKYCPDAESMKKAYFVSRAPHVKRTGGLGGREIERETEEREEHRPMRSHKRTNRCRCV